MMNLQHQQKQVQVNRFCIQIQVEAIVEVVAKVKVEAMQVFNSNKIMKWIKVQVVEDSQEAGGVLEDMVEIPIHNRIVGIVGSLGI